MKTMMQEVMAGRTLAEELGHAYYTVEHILAASIAENEASKKDLLGFIKLNIPFAEPGEIAMPTMGVQRVAKRLAQGQTLLEAVMAEGGDAHGPHFIKKHGLTQESFIKQSQGDVDEPR